MDRPHGWPNLTCNCKEALRKQKKGDFTWKSPSDGSFDSAPSGAGRRLLARGRRAHALLTRAALRWQSWGGQVIQPLSIDFRRPVTRSGWWLDRGHEHLRCGTIHRNLIQGVLDRSDSCRCFLVTLAFQDVDGSTRFRRLRGNPVNASVPGRHQRSVTRAEQLVPDRVM